MLFVFVGNQWAGGHQEVQRQRRWVRHGWRQSWESEGGRGRERKAASSLNVFCRKWRGQRDDPSGAEDAPDPEAGQHRWAEGGLSQEGETLPCLWICWKGQLSFTIPVCIALFLDSKSQHADTARLSLKSVTMATYELCCCGKSGIPRCVARVSSQLFISWLVLFLLYCHVSLALG